MDYSNLNTTFPPGQSGIQPCKMIFHVRVFPVPGRLIMNGCRPIPLALPCHGQIGQMGNPYSDPQSRLPVTLQLIPLKIIIPMGHPVQLAENSLPAVLVSNADSLFRRGKFLCVTQNINPGQLKASIAAHGFPHCKGLGIQRTFGHKVAGKGNSMVFTPFAQGIRIGGCKPLCQMIMVAIAGRGNPAFRQLPEQFRQDIQKVFPVCLLIGLRQIIGEGNRNVPGGFGKTHTGFTGHLRLIGEDSRNRLSKLRSHCFPVSLMRHLNKAPDRRRIEHISISLTIVPWVLFCKTYIGMPQMSFPGHWSFVFFHFPVHPVIFCQASIPQYNAIGCQKISFWLFPLLNEPIECLPVLLKNRILFLRKQQMSGTVTHVPGYHPPGRTGRITILIIEPAEHSFPYGLLITKFDKIHKLIAEIRGFQPGAGMNMETAKTHFLKYFNLFEKSSFLQFPVPCPERSSPVLTGGIAEKGFFQLSVLRLFI